MVSNLESLHNMGIVLVSSLTSVLYLKPSMWLLCQGMRLISYRDVVCSWSCKWG